MDNKVEELVEYMAESLRNTVRMESRCVFESPMSVYKDRAKQILSHPDLALIDRGTLNVAGTYNTVIPLASALKEE